MVRNRDNARLTVWLTALFVFTAAATATAGICAVPCQPGDIPENEPDCGQPVDTVNGGCFNPPLLSSIACGQTICGTTLYDPSIFRWDNDTYAFTLASTSRVTFTLEGEIPMDLYLYLGQCPEIDPLEIVQGFNPCGTTTLTRCLPAGTYYLHAIPNTQSPDPGPCGTRYRLHMACEPCALAPNITCNTAAPLAVPSQTIASNVDGFVNHGIAGCGPPATTRGVWYRVTGTGHTMTASTCNEVTDFDTAISVYCGDCQLMFCVGNNDNENCPSDFSKASASWCSATGVDYFILVYASWGPPVGNFRLDITDDGVPCAGAHPCVACDSTCPPDAAQENEPNCGLTEFGQPDHTVNGGCNTLPPNFSPLELGVPVCGTAALRTVFRDEDWYEFSTDGNTVIRAELIADFDAQLILFAAAPRCPNIFPVFDVSGVRCAPFTGVSPCAPENTYYVIVMPRFTDPTVPCGRNYTLTVTADPCTMCPVAPADAVCDEIVSFDCVSGGQPVACGESGCALALHDGNGDGDCFTVTIDQPTRLHWRVTGQFYYEMQINRIDTTDPQNPFFDRKAFGFGGPCGPAECVACVEPGQYSLVIITELGRLPFPRGLPYRYEVFCDDCAPLEACGPTAIDEAEPDCGVPFDSYNGGCTTGTPYHYFDIQCGVEICGTSARDESLFPDWDFYRLVVTEPTPVTWTVDAAFAADIGISDNRGDPNACTLIMYPESLTLSHTRQSVSKCLTPGTWYFIVGNINTGLPFPCTPYRAKLTCGCPCPGDMDGNGTLDGHDISPLTSCYVNSYDACSLCPCADMNTDGALTAADINLVIQRLLDGGCP